MGITEDALRAAEERLYGKDVYERAGAVMNRAMDASKDSVVVRSVCGGTDATPGEGGEVEEEAAEGEAEVTWLQLSAGLFVPMSSVLEVRRNQMGGQVLLANGTEFILSSGFPREVSTRVVAGLKDE